MEYSLITENNYRFIEAGRVYFIEKGIWKGVTINGVFPSVCIDDRWYYKISERPRLATKLFRVFY